MRISASFLISLITLRILESLSQSDQTGHPSENELSIVRFNENHRAISPRK
ncbi:hypothetical protein UUU_06330 [Klebsiella pneumoniae subsp. pneumoniae DSM 30104 = JCM 1662 = NBRC 14940]|nr:hypothetical protein UUU_06330 [Klebsiella pneumoniae subsp. pneumoniae DSM 30104 = JCM 1662 = NBRC 14940]